MSGTTVTPVVPLSEGPAKLGTIFRSAKWCHNIIEVGNAEAGDRAGAAGPLASALRQAPGQRMTCCRDAHCSPVIWLAPQRPFPPKGGIVVATSTKMRECGINCHTNRRGSRGLRRMASAACFIRGIRLAEADLHPAAGAPCSRQVRVENQRAIYECRAIVKVPDNIAEGMATVRRARPRHPVPARSPVEPGARLRLSLLNERPSSRSPSGARSSGRLWRTPRQIRVAFDRLREQS